MGTFSRFRVASIYLAFGASLLFGQANGKLQIHFIDVGQGDGALMISFRGETVLFDDGVSGICEKPVAYLQRLGVTKIDYHIASHYHADHIGCISEILALFPLQKDALDRGGQYSTAVYTNYLKAIGAHRKTAEPGTQILLDATSKTPVLIDFVASNGNGANTTNENDLSLVAVVHFGKFDAEFGGDLSGYRTGSYEDIETGVAPKVGQIELYKVHHHCSQYSTNDAWLAVTKPIVGIVSVGDGNGYGHPTEKCLERLHSAGVKTYWTERGAGATPEPGHDFIAGSIVVEVDAAGESFAVSRSGATVDRYSVW
jgi:beta-lactamase superfamily II metal-dependent hydrolase